MKTSRSNMNAIAHEAVLLREFRGNSPTLSSGEMGVSGFLVCIDIKTPILFFV